MYKYGYNCASASTCTMSCMHGHVILLGVPKHMTGSPYYYYDWDPGAPFPRGPQNYIITPDYKMDPGEAFTHLNMFIRITTMWNFPYKL